MLWPPMIWLHEPGQIFQRWRSIEWKHHMEDMRKYSQKFNWNEFSTSKRSLIWWIFFTLCGPTLVRIGPEWWRWWWQGTWMGSKGAGHSCQFWAGTKITLSSVLGAGRGKLCNLRHEFHAMLFPRTSSARLVHISPVLCGAPTLPLLTQGDVHNFLDNVEKKRYLCNILFQGR